MNTHTRNGGFFRQGVDDESYMRLGIDFDGEYSDDLIPFFLPEVSMSAFRECPIKEKGAKK